MDAQVPAISHANANRDRKLARLGAVSLGILYVLGRILAVLAAILLALPVLLLPVSTAVPAWLSIPCTIADAGLIFLQFRPPAHIARHCSRDCRDSVGQRHGRHRVAGLCGHPAHQRRGWQTAFRLHCFIGAGQIERDRAVDHDPRP